MARDTPSILYGHAYWRGNRALVREMAERQWELERFDIAGRVVELVRRERPQLVIVDATMQGGGASRVLTELSQNPDLGRFPVVVIEGDEELGADQWLARGASVVVSRNSSVEQVMSEIDRLLDRRVEKVTPSLRMMGEEERFHDAMGGRVFALRKDEFIESLAGMAAKLLMAPLVLITPTDERRQFFASQRSQRGAIPVEVPFSLPRWLLENGGLPQVDDIAKDPMLGGSATIAESRMAAYIMRTVLDWDGKPYALLFVADARPRAWGDRDKHLIDDCARILSGHTTLQRYGFEREEGEIPQHRLVAHAMSSWGEGVAGVGSLIWHADFRLSDEQRDLLAQYVEILGRQISEASAKLNK